LRLEKQRVIFLSIFTIEVAGGLMELKNYSPVKITLGVFLVKALRVVASYEEYKYLSKRNGRRSY